MSVAFTRESDIEAAAADVPPRPISPHPNLVTEEGLAQIDAELAGAQAAYASAQAGNVHTDRAALARAARDLRYWAARRASAQRVEPSSSSERVAFGSRVTVERGDGRKQTWRIVGEDEADPASGSISYLSPLARALLGKAVGECAEAAGAEVEIIALGEP